LFDAFAMNLDIHERVKYVEVQNVYEITAV